MKRTVELLIPAWTAAIPSDWDFEVKFSPADTNFSSWAGQKLMALKGSQFQGSGAAVDGLFGGMIKHGFAKEVTTAEAPKLSTWPTLKKD